VFHIELPPLRDRKEDIPLIVEAMIHNLNRKHDTRVTHATPEFLAGLQERNWEGNVRELRNIIERAVTLAGSGPIRPSHVPFGLKPHIPVEPASVSETEVAPAAPASVEHGMLPVKLGMTIGEAERVLIEATLVHAGMNKTRAASILDISTKTLHTKLRQYQLGSGDALGDEELSA
jgi:DNA-binding NtrC family response regulator